MNWMRIAKDAYGWGMLILLPLGFAGCIWSVLTNDAAVERADERAAQRREETYRLNAIADAEWDAKYTVEYKAEWLALPEARTIPMCPVCGADLSTVERKQYSPFYYPVLYFRCPCGWRCKERPLNWRDALDTDAGEKR